MTTLHTHGLCSRTKLAWALLEGALPVRRTVPRLTKVSVIVSNRAARSLLAKTQSKPTSQPLTHKRTARQISCERAHTSSPRVSVTHAMKEHTTRRRRGTNRSHAARCTSAHTQKPVEDGLTRHHRRRQPRLTSNTTAPLTHSLLHRAQSQHAKMSVSLTKIHQDRPVALPRYSDGLTAVG